MIDAIEESLQAGKTVQVTFTKSNGESRVMKCVGSPEVIGDSYTYVGGSNKSSDHARTVWDVDKHDWRMFIWDNVTGYMVIE